MDSLTLLNQFELYLGGMINLMRIPAEKRILELERITRLLARESTDYCTADCGDCHWRHECRRSLHRVRVMDASIEFEIGGLAGTSPLGE